ncbi:MAG: Rieske (2Fe-2S) protein [Nitrososphaerales archaeon]
MKACDRNGIGADEILGVDLDDRKLMLVNKDEKIFALDRICTHEYADLSTGFVGENYLTCPLHLSQFELETGKALNPPAEKPLRSYKVKIEEDGVYVLLE